jgi:hypothetical protein
MHTSHPTEFWRGGELTVAGLFDPYQKAFNGRDAPNVADYS